MAWKCPYCKQFSTHHHYRNSHIPITDVNLSPLQTDSGHSVLQVIWHLCANPACKGLTVYFERVNNAGKKLFRQIIPSAENAYNLPTYIPEQIRQDYYEACEIISLSPKAAATLLRRCLQGMIRDFWMINEGNLKKEIDALETRQPGTRDLIDPIRKIGNIGAHMEADVNLIIDIEPEEASLLKEMIEQLIEDWYVERHQRQERVAKIQAIVADKELKQKGAESLKAELLEQ